MEEWKRKDSGDGLRREYEAGRISADSYIAAGGDPDVVRSVEAKKAADEAAKKAENEKAGRRIALGCIGIPVLLVGGCMALSALGGGGSDRPETASENTWSAERICKQAVEKQLKNPDSAKFSDMDVSITDSTPPVFGYTVTGTVHATNSFGGTVPNSFTCTATYDSDSGMANGTAKLS